MTITNTLTLTNTLTRKKEPFIPAEAGDDGRLPRTGKVRMYVCGPTVYDRPHIGNARSIVVYDILFRLLRHVYGEDAIEYVRNITDVDDKINKAAQERGETIQALTQEITGQFHADMEALNCLPPTIEPRATEHIARMIELIEKLIDNGYAYAVREGAGAGHVYYDVQALVENPVPDYAYGALSGRKLDELLKEVRKEASPGKKLPGDFVLWKPAGEGDDASSVFPSPWGEGRPGWHIECSAMSTQYLGENFDIHGGGADLKFPHHENEIAQSCGAFPGSGFARVWVHNGFVTVNGEKMSKSLGNFFTVREVLDQLMERYKFTERAAGEVIRYVFLSTKYNEPLDWTEKRVDDAKKALDGWYGALEMRDDGSLSLGERGRVRAVAARHDLADGPHPSPLSQGEGVMEPLANDLNTPLAIAVLHDIVSTDQGAVWTQLLGLLTCTPNEWFGRSGGDADDATITVLINARIDAKKNKDFAKADEYRDKLHAMGVELLDKRDGTTDWRRR